MLYDGLHIKLFTGTDITKLEKEVRYFVKYKKVLDIKFDLNRDQKVTTFYIMVIYQVVESDSGVELADSDWF